MLRIRELFRHKIGTHGSPKEGRDKTRPPQKGMRGQIKCRRRGDMSGGGEKANLKGKRYEDRASYLQEEER